MANGGGHMTYAELRKKQQNAFNALPLGFAFSQKQFDEMMKRWGLPGRRGGALLRRHAAQLFHNQPRLLRLHHGGELAAGLHGAGARHRRRVPAHDPQRLCLRRAHAHTRGPAARRLPARQLRLRGALPRDNGAALAL